MATKKKHTVPYRRKLEGKTNYKKRLSQLMSGELRVIIRKSLKNIQIQIIDYDPDGDKVLLTVTTKELKKLDWNEPLGNIPSAYLVGLLAAKKAKEKKIEKGIIDLGLQRTGSRIYAAIKGLKDGGLDIPCSEEVFPKEDRIKGQHIADYKKTDIVKNFEAVKAKIMGK